MPISSRHAARIKQYDGVERSGRRNFASGNSIDYAKAARASRDRGGTTPFNLIPLHHGAGQSSAGAHGHGAGTPYDLCDWWVRYISPLGGLVVDPFMGSGTVLLAALARKRRVIGIEQMPEYFETATRRIERPHLIVPRANHEDSDASFTLFS